MRAADKLRSAIDELIDDYELERDAVEIAHRFGPFFVVPCGDTQFDESVGIARVNLHGPLKLFQTLLAMAGMQSGDAFFVCRLSGTRGGQRV